MDAGTITVAFETATQAGSIALLRGTEVVALSEGNPELSHSNTLLFDLDCLLSTAGTRIGDINLFAVAIGPGSFTGLRIGLATVKALAETLDKPCVGVPTLEAVAHSAGKSDFTVAMIPAGRGEVFAQSFKVDGHGVVASCDDAKHLAPRQAIARYESEDRVLWSGEGSVVHKELISNLAKCQGKFVNDNSGWSFVIPASNLALHVGLLSMKVWDQNDVQRPDQLRALYVRPSDAEMNANVDR